MSNIKVYCRFRPLNQKETDLLNYNIEEQTIQLGEQKFTYDHIFNTETTQEQVYEKAGHPIIEHLLAGLNATLLMYGQTSSGKTHTMIGDQNSPGLIRRTIEELFDAIESSAQEIVFRIRLSIYEIYKEKVKDLLDITKQDLKVREMVAQGFYVQQVTQLWVSEKQEIFAALQKSTQNRQVGHTNLNEVSSRSHLIFQLTVQMNNEIEESSYTGQLIMADLAGSENASKAGTVGNTLQEGSYINKSLLTLSNVINSLSEKAQHVPYRESNLTKLLWNGLSKNSMTSLIITCSPCITNESETVSTLRFGVRAKMIKTQPKVNREVTVKELEIQNQKLLKDLEDKKFLIEQLKMDQNNLKLIQLEELNMELLKQNQILQEQNLQSLQEIEMKSDDLEEANLLVFQLKAEIVDLNCLLTENEKKYQNARLMAEEQIKDLLNQQSELKVQLQNNEKELNQTLSNSRERETQFNNQEIQFKQSQLPQNDLNQINLRTTQPNKLLEEIDQLQQQLGNEKLKLKQQNKIYESQLSVVNKSNQILENDQHKLLTQIKEFQLKINELTQKNKQITDDLTNRVKKVVDLEEKQDILVEKLNKLQNSLDGNSLGLYYENERLRKQLEEVNKLYASNVHNNSAFQSQSHVLQQKLQQKNSRIQVLEQENYQLKVEAQAHSQIIHQQSSEEMQEFGSQHRFTSQISCVVKKGQIDLL